MLKFSKLRVHWVASFGIFLVLCAYVGQAYYKLRSVEHHVPIVALWMKPEFGWFGERVIEYELRRRIENGDFIGADVLADTLSMGFARDDWKESAMQRADWLIADLVDVNAKGMTGMTPLHQAVTINNPAMAEQLIRLGADPGVKARVVGANNSELDALDYAELVRALSPDRDMSDIFQVLESAMESQTEGVR